MAKRFTDTEKWKKPFLRGLPTAYKLLWLYILDDCDNAGIWHVDFDVANLKTGAKLDHNKALNYFEDRVIPFDGGSKWFVFDFIEFQYGELNPANRAHNSVISKLSRYGIDHKNKPLTEVHKGHTSPLQGAKDKDMDKDMDMDKDKDKGGGAKILTIDEPEVYRQFKHLKITTAEVSKLLDLGYTTEQIDAMIDEVQNYRANNKYTSLFLTVKKWLQRDKKESRIDTSLDAFQKNQERINKMYGQ